MQRIALALGVWGCLLLLVSGLAMLARPEAGPPMPRKTSARNPIGALVPEREVVHEPTRRELHPDELSGTVAPRGEASAPGESSINDVQPSVPPRDVAPHARETKSPAGTGGSEPRSAGSTDAGDRDAQSAASQAVDAGAAEKSPSPDARDDASAASAEARPSPRPQRGESIHGLGSLPAGVPAEEEGFGVHVFLADGRPASDATVRWMLRRDLEALRARDEDPDALDPADALASTTNTVRTTSAGFAMLTSEAGTMLVDARLGDQYGWLRIRREDAGHGRIVLAHDTTLDVAVVDPRGGARVGARVVLRGDACRTIWSGRTGGDGVARLRHADGVVLAARARHDQLSIAVDAPGGEVRALARGEIPVEPVRLVAASGGRVLVRVHDVAAVPCARPTRVRLVPRGRESDCASSRERTAVDGLAVFEDVPAGLDLVAVAETACSPEPLQGAVATGSASETEVVLAATTAMPRVRGRLLDPRGVPWRGYEVVAHADRDGAWLAQGAAKSDDRGGFELDVPALHPASSAPVAITLIARNDWGRTVASARIELAHPTSRDALVDLGDVAANDWPVLVRGTVLDEGERPLEGAPVELCDASGRADPRTRTTCDERGQFALRGPPPPDETILVRAVEPERSATDATVALRRGDWRARIVIAVHGRLAGAVALPDGAPEGSVIVRVDQPSGAQLSLSVDAAGAFAFSNVEPGESRVVFVPEGFDEPVLTLERVDVPRGGACADPRLVRVDLRALLGVVELEVVDERGQPLESAWVGPVGGGRPRGRASSLVDGVARVVVPAATTQPLQISAQGYEPVALSKRDGRVRVELAPSGG